MIVIALTAALLAQDTVPPGTAADLVARARAARERNERLVTAYSATVSQRIGVGVRALSRDRMLFSQELVARIEWRRDAPSRVEVVGAREAAPAVQRGVHVPDDLADQVRWLVINPAEDYLRLVGADADGFVYPLREGGENDYRFSAGDTTTIMLPDGRTIRLLELVVTARRPDFRLMNGSLWFDADSYGLVRAAFRPARAFDFRRDADEEERRDVPGFINPGAEVRYVTIEYGLYEFRWWMPRYIAIDAVGTVGSLMSAPFRYERTYTDYRVRGGAPPPEGGTFRPAGTVRRRERGARGDSAAAAEAADPIRRAEERRARADSIRREIDACVRRANEEAEAETAADAADRDERRRRVRVRVRNCTRRDESDSALVVVIPADTAAMLASPELGAPILAMGDVISEQELRQLGGALGVIAQRPWGFQADLPRGLWAPFEQARYNRVEALSLGLRGTLDFGRLAADGAVRLGIADLEPNAELGLTRPATRARYRLGVFRRLAAANPDTRPFGALNSFSAFWLQRDDGEYYRTLGLELTGRNTGSGWWSWRLFAERHRPASVETQVSLPRLFSPARTFRPNIAAQDADLAGASLTLRGTRVVSRSVVLGADAVLDGATGDFDYGRGALTLRTTLAPGGPAAFAIEVAAGATAGRAPVQGLFYLGGPATVRGYAGGAAAGPMFWRGRAEVAGSGDPGARLALFADAGWTGTRDVFFSGRPLVGAGVGASFLDGLVRLDLSHGFGAGGGWRFDFYADGIF